MLLSIISVAYAMAPQAGDGAKGGGFTAFIPLILMFVIFYFLLIRPQQAKTKKHQQLLNNLKRDDMVVTTGGIHGKVTGITDTIVTIEVAQNVRIKVSKGNVAAINQANNTVSTKSEEKSK